jgi:hypothetical protein
MIYVYAISPAVIESMLSTLSPRQLVLLVLGGLIIGAGLMGAFGVILRWALSPITKKWTKAINDVTLHADEWSKAFDRIPPQDWFDKVAIALDGINGQAAALASHTKNLIEIEADVKELRSKAEIDHEKLLLLKRDHDAAGAFGRRRGDTPGCAGLPLSGEPAA